MKQPILFLIFAILFHFESLHAQQHHFIYLQTDHKQPFYVRLDKKIYSSSESGYLIIPKLLSGEYQLHIGFPKKEWPEQPISCMVADKDLGYLLKNFEEKGWGIFNLQTLELTMLGEKKNTLASTKQESTDPFANLVSSVVNDPSIKQETVQQKDTVQTKPIVQEQPKEVVVEVKADSATTTSITPALEKIPSDTVKAIVPNAYDTIAQSTLVLNTVKKLLQDRNDRELLLQYSYTDSLQTDTIQAIFELEMLVDTVTASAVVKDSLPGGLINIPVLETPIQSDTIARPAPIAASKKEELFLPIELPHPEKGSSAGDSIASPILSKEQPPATEVNKAPILANSDCKEMATEDDFLKLRKRMAGGKDDDEMMAIAKKVFKTKCFATEQIKNLSVLFLSDASRYAFYDVAYPFVSDTHFFPQLEKLLSDPYYINRFKAMLRR